MFFNQRKTCAALQPPSGLGPADIAMQSSICTGETIIGFRQPGTDRLLQAVVVHSPQDVADFYRYITKRRSGIVRQYEIYTQKQTSQQDVE